MPMHNTYAPPWCQRNKCLLNRPGHAQLFPKGPVAYVHMEIKIASSSAVAEKKTKPQLIWKSRDLGSSLLAPQLTPGVTLGEHSL